MDDDLAYLGDDYSEAKSLLETPRLASPPLVERKVSTSAAAVDASTTANDRSTVDTKLEVSRSQEKEEEEDDWLAGVLSRKKAQSASDSENKLMRREETSGPEEEQEDAALESNMRYEQCTKIFKLKLVICMLLLFPD